MNLITNPHANDGLTGWTFNNVGDGWHITSRGHDDSTGFQGSYRRGTMWQTIDLLQYYDTAYLDTQPTIYYSTWYRRYAYPDEFQNIITLYDFDGNVMHKEDTGVISVTSSNWNEYSWTFADYGFGLREIRVTMASEDTEFWSGHYGAIIDDVSLKLSCTLISQTAYSLQSESSYV